MGEKGFFSSRLTMPFIDLAMVAALILAGGFVWYRTMGRERLTSGEQALHGLRVENAGELERLRAKQRDIDAELGAIKLTREDKHQIISRLVEQMRAEDARIQEYVAQNALMTDRLIELRAALQRVAEQRDAVQSDLTDVENQIILRREEIAALEAQYTARGEELAGLNQSIADMRRGLAADPPSRLPERSALASVIEITDPEERWLVSLTRGLARVGRLDVGLLGSLGLSAGAGSSLKEGGLFANLPLAHRRVSIDFEGGFSQLQSRSGNASETTPFAGATLRLAPIRRERLFLLAGTRYGHDDLGLRLGLGLGRR